MGSFRLGRAVTAALALLVVPVASYAQIGDAYFGPRVVTFFQNGALTPSRSGSIDLFQGTADIAGPCEMGRSCAPSAHRRLILSPEAVGKLRLLVINVNASGLFDNECLDALHRSNEAAQLEERHNQAEQQKLWKKSHPRSRGIPPIHVPLPDMDPSFASITVEGAGTAIATNDYDGQKGDWHCVTQSLQALWTMVRTF